MTKRAFRYGPQGQTRRPLFIYFLLCVVVCRVDVAEACGKLSFIALFELGLSSTNMC